MAESGSVAAARADVRRHSRTWWRWTPGLPDGDGLRLARESRDREADLGIVLLTCQEEDDVLFRALEGVSAFVAKSAAGNILIAARAASRG